MPVFQDQQAVEQLLSGLNSMQMQAGLMPGMSPMQSPMAGQTPYQQQQAPQSAAQFSNYLRVQHQADLFMASPMSPIYAGASPVARNPYAQSVLPPAQLGAGWGMARQQAQGSFNTTFTGAQTAVGIGARLGLGSAATTVGAVAGTALGGPIGGVIGGFVAPWLADSFIGEGVERVATMPFRSLINQRQRGMQLQHATTQFMRSGSELSASGIGLSNTGAYDLERNITRMSEGAGFKRATGNQFNRQDMVRITQLAAQTGLLDNAQSVEQITRDMGKIGRALTTFMKVMDEPDVQAAMSMMGKMRNLGMNLPEMGVAAQHARTFARMAGTNVQNVMQAGMQGAQMFQGMGLSGATGLATGMAAVGNAGILSGMLSPHQLSMLGGREGVTQNLTAAAANVANLDVLLPGLLRKGKEGLEIDQEAMLGLASGKKNIQDMVRESARRMAGFGPKGFVEEYGTRKNELRDQLMGAFGGQGAILAPMMIAQGIAATGATDFRGGLRLQGLSEEQARTIELARTPEFFQRMRAQTDNHMEQRRAEVQRRQSTFEEASSARSQRLSNEFFGTYVQRQARRLGRKFDNVFRGFAGDDQDTEEERLFLGGGETLARTPGGLGTEEELRAITAQLGTAKGRQSVYGKMNNLSVERGQRNQARNKILEDQEQQRQTMATYMTSPVANFIDSFRGENGFSLFDAGRGSIGNRRVLRRNQSRSAQWAFSFGADDLDEDHVKSRTWETVRGGELLQQARTQGFSAERSKIAENVAGLKDATKYDRAASVAATAANTYMHSLGANYFSNNGGFSLDEMRKRVAADLQQRGGLSPEEAARYAQNDATTREYLRLGEMTRTAEGRAVAAKQESASGDLKGLSTSRDEAVTEDMVNKSRNSMFAQLGIKSSDLETSQAKQLLNIMSGTGPEATARRKLFQARALAAEGSTESKEKATQVQREVERMGLSAEKMSELTAEASGVADSFDSEDMKQIGKYLGSKNIWETRDTADAFMTDKANQTRSLVLQNALEKKLGKGATTFRLGQAKGTSAKDLAAYIEKSGGKLEGHTLTDEQFERAKHGKLTQEEIEAEALGKVMQGSKSVTEGGNVAGDAAPTSQEKFGRELIDTLSAGLQRDSQTMLGSFTRLDGAADKIASAADSLKEVAGAIANQKDLSRLDRATNDAKATSQNQSLLE